MAHSTQSARRAAFDMDEIAPDRFIVHNQRIGGVLKGEGNLTGKAFELTTWRREGLLGRLRERGFTVRTIADRVAGLPATPPPILIGGAGWRALATSLEQFSHFDLRQLRWHAITPTERAGVPGVVLYDGWVLRRRKGRGAASFYLAHKERAGGIGLRPIGENMALLAGYAQALEIDPRPLIVERRGELVLLPEIVLPPAYRAVLMLIAQPAQAGWAIDQRGWPHAAALFARLGLHLTIEEP